MSLAGRIAGLAAAALVVACASQARDAGSRAEATSAALAPAAGGERVVSVRCARVVTMDGEDRVFEPGSVVLRDGRIAYVGPAVDPPAGSETIELDRAWALPGMVELHSHAHTGGWNDLNDGMRHVAPELSSAPAVVPANPFVRRACASGVTTLFGIPGSATSMSGFGVIYKARTKGGFEDVVVADPGGLKVAQTHNPDRNPNSVLRTWAGLGWVLEKINEDALAALAEGRDDPRLADLMKVHAGELPVLVHCAGAEGVANTARMWRETFPTRSVLSHGSFDGWRSAAYVASLGMPVNHGPRLFDYHSSRTGRVEPSALVYERSGGPSFSLNTDAPVIPQEELFLQGAMAARQGVDGYRALRALTIGPAEAIGLGDRLGSLEPGKDGDVVLWSGDPLDPRSRVELVLIDGEIQYDRKENGQWS